MIFKMLLHVCIRTLGVHFCMQEKFKIFEHFYASCLPCYTETCNDMCGPVHTDWFTHMLLTHCSSGYDKRRSDGR